MQLEVTETVSATDCVKEDNLANTTVKNYWIQIAKIGSTITLTF